MESNVIARLAANTKIGYSLDRKFYCDDEVFAADMEQVVGRKWIVAGHVDRVRNKGDYFLMKIGGESIIIVRSDESTINAFYNVCRHRGSLICTKPQGRVARFTCGYHAWSYGLDGALLAARLMPADFSKKDNGLHRCHLTVFHGFIFINLSDRAPVDFDATFGDLGPYLDFHGFAGAKIAHAQSYPTAANWKLVVENFVECYHCAPAHPEFCSMHPPEALIAFGAGPSSGPAEAVEKYLPALKAWEARAASLGRPIGSVDDGPESSHLRLLLQRTIRNHAKGCAKCASGEGHPLAVLTVSYPGGGTRQFSLRRERVAEVRRWLRNYQKLKATIEAICELNHELLRPEQAPSKRRSKPRD